MLFTDHLAWPYTHTAGHSGSAAAEYTSRHLPITIRESLRAYVQSIPHGARLFRGNVAAHADAVCALLRRAVERFDADDVGGALRAVCPRPWELAEAQARRVCEEHEEVVDRAFSGTTAAVALVSLDERFMWAVGVGDSSVGMAVVDDRGITTGRRMCEIHSFKDPQEYFRASMTHPHEEQPLFDGEHILGWLGVPRTIGDFPLKLHASYTSHLFPHLPRLRTRGCDPPLSSIHPRIRTPPYVSATPSVRFTDLEPHWDTGARLVLFTDGVDSLLDGYFTFTPRQRNPEMAGEGTAAADVPVEVVAGLLGAQWWGARGGEPDLAVAAHRARLERVLGHAVVPRWSGDEDNRAVDVLGNLLGGSDVEKLEMVTDLGRLEVEEEDGWALHVDDTSIVVWTIKDA
ncbi:phosphatase 2C-like domain-containing protein [Trametes polyzona]|nr:phosphatase 2C-like domain-containing protein [Trametes polyzona]